MIKNEYGIKNITINATSKNFCPLGKDWYTNNFEIEIEVGRFIPDYCEVDAFIAAYINGKSMIIEEAVNVLYEHITKKYNPIKCAIRSKVTDAKHSSVVVEKE